MSTILRAYIVEKVGDDYSSIRLTLSDGITEKIKNVIINKEIPLPVDEKKNSYIDIIGRIPAETVERFQNSGILVGGLPTQEKETTGPTELKSIKQFMAESPSPLHEGDVVIIVLPTFETDIKSALNETRPL